ncbi:hypothetical protein ABFX02_09G091400 [Erythranthe guttata]
MENFAPMLILWLTYLGISMVIGVAQLTTAHTPTSTPCHPSTATHPPTNTPQHPPIATHPPTHTPHHHPIVTHPPTHAPHHRPIVTHPPTHTPHHRPIVTHPPTHAPHHPPIVTHPPTHAPHHPPIATHPPTHAPHHPPNPANPPTHAPCAPSKIACYDVTHFGAVGDGKTNDTKAFQAAWKAACNGTESEVKITVPFGKSFLVFPVVFNGPCKCHTITFEILGKIIAPPRSGWSKKGTDEWLYFHRVDNLLVSGDGKGLLDGKGETWWQHGSSSRPTALRFSHCSKLNVRGLKHINSGKNHVSLNHCDDVNVSNLTMIAPQFSPNTDGIDISASTNLHIHNCTMETGDDCIAINGGTSNVMISNIRCGPGHGISIGSLGKKGKHEIVEAISVRNCTFNRTENGVRIKTWQGGSGFARNITFANIRFIDADNPVIIDQYYCPHKKCANKTSAVQVTDVTYMGLHGTSSCKNATINFSCSETFPCTNIVLKDVDIESDDPSRPTSATCINAHARVDRTLKPTLNCLMLKKRGGKFIPTRLNFMKKLFS